MSEIHLRGLFVQPIADRIRAWSEAGKVTEDDLDRALTTEARAHVEHSIGSDDWASLEDVEGLIALACEHVGGESALVDWADQIVEGFREEDRIASLIRSSRSLIDAEGFMVSQGTALLVRDADWFYDGGRSAFSVRLTGVREASPALKSLLGALLARLAVASGRTTFDVRFEGVDGDELVVFGEGVERDLVEGESRLHQAALVP